MQTHTLYQTILKNPQTLMTWVGLGCVLEFDTHAPKPRMLGGTISQGRADILVLFLKSGTVPEIEILREIYPNMFSRMENLHLNPESLQDLLLFWFFHHTKEGSCRSLVHRATIKKELSRTNTGHACYTTHASEVCVNPMNILPVEIGEEVFVHAGQVLCRVQDIPPNILDGFRNRENP